MVSNFTRIVIALMAFLQTTMALSQAPPVKNLSSGYGTIVEAEPTRLHPGLDQDWYQGRWRGSQGDEYQDGERENRRRRFSGRGFSPLESGFVVLNGRFLSQPFQVTVEEKQIYINGEEVPGLMPVTENEATG